VPRTGYVTITIINRNYYSATEKRKTKTVFRVLDTTLSRLDGGDYNDTSARAPAYNSVRYVT